MRVKRVKAYSGVDPTASSLHLGHLVTFMPLFWMYLHGYGAITLIGTSTAKIGDPTDRTDARAPVPSAEQTQYLAGIHHQLKAIWVTVEGMGKRFGYNWDWAWFRAIVNNNHWWNKQPLLEVMVRLGNHVRLGPLLGRDNVKKRLDQKDGSGMAFSEFMYPLMQGWDWFTLFKQRGVQMQIGGSDQYGNILTGIECVKAVVRSEPNPAEKLSISGELEQPFGFTVPLLTDSSGVKFGKSAGNAIWLDPFMTTPFDMYGYLVRRSDDEVERLLKLLTFHPLTKIAQVMKEHRLDPRKRVAQHLLAYEVLWLVHGKPVTDETRDKHKSLYGSKMPELVPSSATVPQSYEQYITKEGPVSATDRPRAYLKLPIALLDQSVARIMYAAGLASSIMDADRSIKAGGVYLGGQPGAQGITYQTGMTPGHLQFAPIKAWDPSWTRKYLIDDKLLLIRKGKHNLRCIEFISDEAWQASGLEYTGQPLKGAFRQTVAKLNMAIDAARAKKGEDGVLAEEDKISEQDLTRDELVGNERIHKKIRSTVKKAEDENLLKEDPDKW